MAELTDLAKKGLLADGYSIEDVAKMSEQEIWVKVAERLRENRRKEYLRAMREKWGDHDPS